MQTLTELLLAKPGWADTQFVAGARRDDPVRRARCKKRWATVRRRYDLAERAPLLTPGDANLKLDKASHYTVGLTLAHYVTKLTTGLTLNACPNAGDCTKVCVLDNGHGRWERVQRVRRARTEFFARYPGEACFLLGWELADVVEARGGCLFRPNVNSDVSWELVLPSLTGGAVFGDAVLSYGYSKLTDVLHTDGWLDKHYRVAYSWSERSGNYDVRHFLERGGSVAMVTARRKGEKPAPCWIGRMPFSVVDADLTDEWMFQRGVIGDLSAKGKARRLIGVSAFIA